MSAANLSRSKIDRGQQPGLLDPLWQTRRQSGCAGVAGLQAIQRGSQILRNPRFVYLESPKDGAEIRISPFDQLQQKMLRLDIVVRARETKSGSSLESAM